MITTAINLQPVLTETDYHTLRNILRSLSPAFKSKEVKEFADELERTRVVKDNALTDDVVRLYSTVKVEDVDRKTTMTIQLVKPEEASLVTGKVSVFAPLSIALIGYKKNDSIDWKLPTGVKRLRIVDIDNTQKMLNGVAKD